MFQVTSSVRQLLAKHVDILNKLKCIERGAFMGQVQHIYITVWRVLHGVIF